MSDIKISELEELTKVSASNNILIPVACNNKTYKVPLSTLASLWNSDIIDLNDRISEIEESATGEDTSKWEFVYKITSTNTKPTTPNNIDGTSNGNYIKASNAKKVDDFIPDGWTDNPNSISQEQPYAWASLRVGSSMNWGEFLEPIIWSRWGEKGRDGDGVEYVYKPSKLPKSGMTSNYIMNGVSVDDSTYQSNYEYYPTDLDGYVWLDDPIDLENNEEGYLYQYVSIRKKINGEWGAFSDAKLWNYKAQDGEAGSSGNVIDFTNDSLIIEFLYNESGNLECIDTNGANEGIANTTLFGKLNNDDVIIDTVKAGLKGNPNITLSNGVSLTINDVTFTPTFSSNEVKIKITNCNHNTSLQHPIEFLLSGKVNDVTVLGSKILKIAEVLPGADGHAVGYQIVTSTNGITSDTYGYNAAPSTIEVYALKIVDGVITDLKTRLDFLDNNLHLDFITNLRNTDSDSTTYETTTLLSSQKGLITLDSDFINNEIMNYLNIELYLEIDGELKKWDNETINKTHNGEPYLNIQFDTGGLNSISVNSAGTILDDISNQTYTFTFGIYKGNTLLESDLFIDNKINSDDVNEYIAAYINGTALSEDLQFSSGGTYLLKDGNKFKLIVPGSVLALNCEGLSTSILTIKCHFYSTEDTALDIIGSKPIYKTVVSSTAVAEVEIPVSAFTAAPESVDIDTLWGPIKYNKGCPPSDTGTYIWTTYPVLKDGCVIYMTTGTKYSGDMKADSNGYYWSKPACLGDGTSSGTGADGDGYNYIYCRTESYSTPTVPTKSVTEAETIFAKSTDNSIYGIKNNSEYNSTKEDINIWYDHPVGVSDTYKYEWISIAKYDGSTKTWGSYETSVLWSKYGEKGIDGDGVEYIYILLDSELTDTSVLLPKNYEDYDTYTYQSDDYIPINPQCLIINNKTKTLIIGTELFTWSDNPQTISDDDRYQYVSIRKKKYDENGVGTYGDFSTPTLWSKYGIDAINTGYVILSDNDSIFVDDDTTDAIENIGLTEYTLTGPNGLVNSDVIYTIGNVTSTDDNFNFSTTEEDNPTSGTLGCWTINLTTNNGVGKLEYEYTNSSIKLIKGNSISIEIEAFVKDPENTKNLTPGTFSEGETSVTYYKVASRKLKIVIDNFSAGEVYKLSLTPRSLSLYLKNGNSYFSNSGTLTLNVTTYSGNNEPTSITFNPTTSTDLKYTDAVILNKGDLGYLIEPLGDENKKISSLSWTKDDEVVNISSYYVVNLCIYNGTKWVKIDSETFDVVKDGADGASGASYNGTGSAGLDVANGKFTVTYSHDVPAPCVVTYQFINAYSGGDDITYTHYYTDDDSYLFTMELKKDTMRIANTSDVSLIIKPDGLEFYDVEDSEKETSGWDRDIKNSVCWINCALVDITVTKDGETVLTDSIMRTGDAGYYWNVDEDGVVSVNSDGNYISSVNQTALSIVSTISGTNENLCPCASTDNNWENYNDFTDSELISTITTPNITTSLNIDFGKGTVYCEVTTVEGVTTYSYISTSVLANDGYYDVTITNESTGEYSYKEYPKVETNLNTPSGTGINTELICTGLNFLCKLVPGNTYTLSMYIKGTEDCTYYSISNIDLIEHISCNTDTFTRVSKTFTLPSSADEDLSITIYTSEIGYPITVSSIQLEEGELTTSWKTYGNSISTLSLTNDEIQAKVKNLDNKTNSYISVLDNEVLICSENSTLSSGLTISALGSTFTGNVAATSFLVNKSDDLQKTLDTTNGVLWLTTLGVASLYGKNTLIDEDADDNTPVFLIKNGDNYFILNLLKLTTTSGERYNSFTGIVASDYKRDANNMYSDIYKSGNSSKYYIEIDSSIVYTDIGDNLTLASPDNYIIDYDYLSNGTLLDCKNNRLYSYENSYHYTVYSITDDNKKGDKICSFVVVKGYPVYDLNTHEYDLKNPNSYYYLYNLTSTKKPCLIYSETSPTGAETNPGSGKIDYYTLYSDSYIDDCRLDYTE